jgi:hypothetical protein
VLRACHYIYGAAVGLNHVHEIGLIHRDIKPSNILVDRHGMVKILDLGLARFFHDTDELTKKYDENILGTADYLSPEQAVDSHTVDIRTDIYSLGATFYYLLTGQPPFPEGTVTQKLIWHQTRDPKPITAYRSDVPPEIIAIIDKMMKKKPEERYQTPAELMQALSPWVTVPIPPPSEQELPALSRAAGGGTRPQVSAGPITPITPSPASAAGDSSSVSTLPSLGPAGVPHPPPLTPPPGASELYPGVAALPPSAPRSSEAVLPPSPPVGTGGPSSSSAETPGVSLVAPVAPAAVWENLSESWTGGTAAARVQPPSSVEPPRVSRRPAATAARSPRLIFLAGAGVLLVTAGAAIAWYFLKGFPVPPTAPQGAGSTSRQRTWIVSKAGGEPDTVPSLREALLKAAPGDLILIREAKISEPPLRLDRQRHKNITIRGDPRGDTYPIWEAIGGGRSMLDISGVEGVQLQKLVLDGADQATNGVFLSGIIPGVVLEQITCQRCSLAAVRCQNVTGSAEQPVHIRHARFLLNKPEQIGIHLAALNASTQYLQITDCRFEGNNNSVGIRLEGNSQNVLISEGRFFQLRSALRLGPVPGKGTCQGTFQRNVLANCAEGLVWDRQVPKAANSSKETPGKYSWQINGNYFVSIREIGKGEGGGGPLEGLQLRDNARAPGCGEGNLGWQIPERALPQPLKTDPNDDATFLRLPPGGQLPGSK